MTTNSADPSHRSHASPAQLQNRHARASFARLAVSKLLIFFVLAYRATLGPFLAGHCRFHPTCSQYMIDAIQKYGPLRGLWRGIKRIARCHPFGSCGYDPA